MKLFTYLGCAFILVLLSACEPQNTSIQEQPLSASCNNNQPCRYESGVKVWLSEPTLSPEEEFSIHVSLPDNLQIEQSKLVGVTMYMGYIPLNFEPFQDHFIAHTMVGICSERKMTWQLSLNTVDDDGSNQTLSYFFDVVY